MEKDESKRTGSLTGLAKRLSRLSPEKRRAALEVSASLAGVSLRASRTFVEAVPRAAKILSDDDIRNWGELGRRLTMASAESGVTFFEKAASGLVKVPKEARPNVFRICTKQIVVSSSVAIESFDLIPIVAAEINDRELVKETLKLGAEIANRSAKHSLEFLKAASPLASRIASHGIDKSTVSAAVFALGNAFAVRTGGMTADLWRLLPRSIDGLSAQQISKLTTSAEKILEFGASVTLNFIPSASEILRRADDSFDEWLSVVHKVASGGNAVLIAFLRSTPRFVKQIFSDSQIERAAETDSARLVKSVLRSIARIAESDAESALAAFRSSTAALKKVSIDQFEEWIETGLNQKTADSAKARRSYFALETRESNALLRETKSGLSLEKIHAILAVYIEGLTGKEIEIVPLSAMPQESRIGDERTIHLPSTIAEFEDDETNFRLYKVLSAHGAGQIEFGTFAKSSTELKAAFAELKKYFEASADDRDAFSLDGYIHDRTNSESAESNERKPKIAIPDDIDYRELLKLFHEPRLARKIFGTMENARIDSRLRHEYRGLRKDLDLMESLLRNSRPYIFDVPSHQVPFELLFQITLCGGAKDDARQFYGQIVSEIESVIEYFLSRSTATVADSIMATSRVYNLFQNITLDQTAAAEENSRDEEFEFSDDADSPIDPVLEDEKKKEPRNPKKQDVKDLFTAWNKAEEETEPDDLNGAEAWTHNEVPEQPLEVGDEAFSYDEWDRELNDYRVGWSRVIEKSVKNGERTFVELTRSRYRGVISSIRHQFQLMKPENLTRINRELDGEDYDLNAVVDFVVDRRTDGQPSENIYTKRLRRQRDVAVSLLLDQSSSTARTITRNPLQPYTYPGRRIIEIEKEGLVLMSEALEAVGDIYSINGFTSEGRRNVKFYVVKDFHEKYSEETERRIGGISFQNNTRLGAAVRHASSKLLKQESRTKLLIVLTDGRPYDHDYGDARYARDDVREALIEAKSRGITPFCITIDRESEAELRDLYGDVGYTIIDDVMTLPERMPNIYRRLTS